MSTLKVDAIRHNSATSDAITTASDGTCTAKLTSIGGGGLSHRNIIVNGAMTVAQRGVSSTAQGYETVDRFKSIQSSIDEVASQAQVDVASGTTPYTLGFRKAFKFTNGNQTSGAGTGDLVKMMHRVEAQDIANSGWDYLSSSSYITISFWVKSSVSQNFYVQLIAYDNATYNYTFETGSLTADTWTKVTHSIPGNSNIRFDNDNGLGLEINWIQFGGTDRTSSGFALNTWASYASGSQSPDMTSTWYTTNDATFELTGVQLEVGDTATTFEHRSHAEELRRCQRYFFSITGDNNTRSGVLGYANSSSEFRGVVHFPVTMRAAPSFTGSATAAVIDSADDSATFNVNALSMSTVPQINQGVVEVSTSSMTAGQCGQLEFRANNGFMNFSAEL